LGLKENVIVGHLIPAGTGLRDFGRVNVGSKEDFQQMLSKTSQTEAEELEVK
jgi:DNA-directed RNA polymerase subunit beta'